MPPLLQVSNLNISFPRSGRPPLIPVDDISLQIDRGEWLALVGESGCGKSLTGLAIPRLLPAQARIGTGSSIRLDGEELCSLSERQIRPLRGRRIGMVFQDPGTTLNPVMRVGNQVVEAIIAHPDLKRRISDPRQRAIELFAEVGIPDPARRIEAWPHQLSGGMRQRVMLAIALATEPDLLIADEPTTALDVTVQAQILELLEKLRSTHGMAIILITHDLGIVAGRADRTVVMYAGREMESAATEDLFQTPIHPYTRGLFSSIPRLNHPLQRLRPIPGQVPPPDRWPEGCRFRPRCPVAIEPLCRQQPALVQVSTGHRAACWVNAGPESD